MRIEIESIERERQEVRFRCWPGSVTARWHGEQLPQVGERLEVEFTTEPTCVWGVDATLADPHAPDSLRQDAHGYEFIGTVDPVSPNDLSDGIFYLRIADGLLMCEAEGLPADAGGRRVRVRQKTLEVFPYDI